MIKVLELFGGIGACTSALKRLNVEYKVVDYVEIDKYAVISYNAMNGTNFTPQDITQWNKQIDVDLIMHGSPCQDFSKAGKGKSGDEGSGTRSSLLFETLRIVENLNPKYIIWENVPNVLSKKHKHIFDEYIEKLIDYGYENHYTILNSKDFGIPQNRERLFVVSIQRNLNQYFKFPDSMPLKYKLKDFLEGIVLDNYYLSDKQLQYVLDTKNTAYNKGYNINNSIINPSIAKTISCRGVKDQRANITNFIIEDFKEDIKVLDLKLYIKNNTKKGYLIGEAGDGLYTNTSTKRDTVQKQMIPTLTSFNDKGVILDDLRIRKITPLEAWRLMGFKDFEYYAAALTNISNSQLYKQAGNSIVVDVLYYILKNLLKGYERNE